MLFFVQCHFHTLLGQIRRTPAEQRLVDQRAARVARNWRRMFRYVRLRQAFSGWSAEKIKWSLEQVLAMLSICFKSLRSY
jgi:hypothetical protein